MHVLIDGDILVYRCGFAAQYNTYTLLWGDSAEKFRYKRDLDAFVKDNDLTDFTVTKEITVEPESHALQNVKTTINQILERIKATSHSIYLTGKNNFRDEVAKVQGYKANRDPDHKPAHYHAIKEYLITSWKAEIVNGIEADDIVASEQSPESIIVSTDKDLDQVPGLHYNWVKDELYEVTHDEAEKFFWTQMITGDSTDNIRGIPQMGPVKAKKYLEKFEPHEWPEAVLDLYEHVYAQEGVEVYNEHYSLIRLEIPDGWNRDDNTEKTYTRPDDCGCSDVSP